MKGVPGKPFCLFVLTLLLSANMAVSASAQDVPDLVVTTDHINPVRDARTPWDEIRNCLSDQTCSAIITSMAGQLGVSPQAIGMVKAGAVVSAEPQGEETHYSIAPLKGYKICRVEVRTTSVVPATGDRASLFSITATPDSVAIYTWTPRQGVGAGRSWYDGIVAVAHAKEEAYSSLQSQGKCTVPQSGANYQCRGASGVNHGLAACSSKSL